MGVRPQFLTHGRRVHNGGMQDLTDSISYMARTRAYYLALGYNNPYEWAHFMEVPFHPMAKPRSEEHTSELQSH